jgi:hypothetical protein
MFSYNPAQRPVVQSWISLTTGYPKIQSKLPNSLLINFDIIIISSEIWTSRSFRSEEFEINRRAEIYIKLKQQVKF